MRGMIDYAGLFPPASLGMPEAVRAYALHRAGPDQDLLGRFIVPAARLGELASEAADVLPSPMEEAWRLSVIVGDDHAQAREQALEFNSSHGQGAALGCAVCDAAELRIGAAKQIGEALDEFPASFDVFLEIPLREDSEDLIAAMSGTRARAKVRTGGITPAAIPSLRSLLRFLRACCDYDVPFKATAGLHHAVRGERALTYETDSPRAKMHGYLNVFLAAAFLHAGLPDDDALQLLDERDPREFVFGEDAVSWRGYSLRTAQLEKVRAGFALSYGSCSFTEPVDEARALGLIG